MKSYLISEQDIDEYFWEIENILMEILEKIKEKEVISERG